MAALSRKLSDRVERFLESQPKSTILLIGILIMLLVATVDFLPHGHIFSFLIFYMMPVLLVSWFADRTYAIFMSVCCAAAWLLSDILVEGAPPLSIVPYANMVIKFGFFFWISAILLRLKLAMETQKAQSRTDFLTGLVNRQYFVELAEQELDRLRRYRRPFTLLYIDVDDFKQVNDRSGHHSGDRVLSMFGRTLRNILRRTDTVARLGGDEFAVLMPETTLENAGVAVKHVKDFVRDNPSNFSQPITMSIGSVTFLRAPASVDEMIRQADRLMYRVKESGKDNFKMEVFS